MFQRYCAIAAVSFIETVRQPIFGVLLVITAMMIILNVSLAAFTLKDDDKLLLDLGLSTLLLSGLFLASFSATGVLSREIENKTVLTVIAKPVSRPLFLLGKFTGLCTALFLAHYLSFLAFILAQRHGVLQNSSDPWDMPVLVLGGGSVILALGIAAFCNYLYDKDFVLTVLALVTPMLTLSVLVVAKLNEDWSVIPFGSNFVGGQIIIAAFFVLLINFELAAVATAASTRFGQLPTLVICVCFLGLALISDYTFASHAEDSTIASVAYHLTPNIGPLWIIDGLTSDREETIAPWNYVGYVTAYALLWVVGVLSIGIALFQRREIG